MNKFVTAMIRDGNGFLYLQEKYLKDSEAKIKDSIFINSQIRKFLKKNSLILKNLLGNLSLEVTFEFSRTNIDQVF